MRQLIAVIIFAIAGPILFYKGCSGVVAANQSRSWPSAEGRVYASKVGMNPGRWGSTHYYPEIRYAFTVDGREYVSDQVSFSNSWSQEDAMAMTRSHPVGTNLEVYYDPEDPARSVIAPGRAGGDWFRCGFGAVMLAVVGLNGRRAWLRVREVMNGNL